MAAKNSALISFSLFDVKISKSNNLEEGKGEGGSGGRIAVNKKGEQIIRRNREGGEWRRYWEEEEDLEEERRGFGLDTNRSQHISKVGHSLMAAQ